MNAIPALITCALLLSASGCSPPPPTATVLDGYVTADWLYLAAPSSGWLETLHAEAGQTLAPGSIAFTLDNALQSFDRQAAEAEFTATQAQRDDLRYGKRSEELAAIDARIQEARASLEYAIAEQRRQMTLIEKGLAPPATADRLTENVTVARARLATLRANRQVAQLGARPDLQRAAEARVTAARARADRAAWLHSERAVRTRVGGRVERIFYRPGEFVTAGVPVLALLPPGRIKVRFYIPESQRTRFQIGQTVLIHQDGAPEDVPATIRYISQEVEQTPPVIFSERTRAALVFMAEAYPAASPQALHPGMPVEVRP